MASSLASSRLIIFRAISRRWYSGRAVEEKGGMVKRSKKESVGGFSSPANTSSWVPDPVTGYYRPGNKRPEVDAAELRKAMLSHGSS